jgi:tricarballylate dehydrogenase
MNTSRNPHILVVGAGNAALTAALAANESGATVSIFEKAPPKEWGGNSRFSGGVFRFGYDSSADIRDLVSTRPPYPVDVPAYSSTDYFDDLLTTSGRQANYDLVLTLAEHSLSTVQWMSTHGVRWEYSKIFGVESEGGMRYPAGTAVQAEGAGLGLMARLRSAISNRGITIHYNTPMKYLVKEGEHVTGIIVQENDREELIRGDGVILAAGGFEADAEMRKQYLGDLWHNVTVRGSRFDTGEVLREALNVGAARHGQWNGCHATPVAADAPSMGKLELTDTSNRLSYPYGITVNIQGNRFMDEGATEASHSYARMGQEILKQPDHLAYQIFDSNTVSLLEARYQTTRPFSANTLSDLAKLLKLPESNLLETVREFNDAANGFPFDPGALDGKCTTGISIDKSNWAMPIASPPYIAYPVCCGITFTYGGLHIDDNARVLQADSEPVPGLFATGEITGGFFYDNYPGGAGLMRGAVFGRIAGHTATMI